MFGSLREGGARSWEKILSLVYRELHSLAHKALRDEAPGHGVALDDFANVEAWYGRVRSRPAVGRGVELLRDRWVDVSASAEARQNLFKVE